MNFRLLPALIASALLTGQAVAQDLDITDETCSVSHINEVAQKEGLEKAQNLAQVCIKNGYENLKTELKAASENAQDHYKNAKEFLNEKGSQYKEKAQDLKKRIPSLINY